MAGDDKRYHAEEDLAHRLTLVLGEPGEPAPRPELIVDAEWQLLQAVKRNDTPRVAEWLALGADPNARDRDGRTALYEVGVAWKQQAIAELLLDRGADLRLRDRDGQTPLHAAAMFAHEDQVRLFVDRGAEIDARDACAQTPLHCAAGLGRVDATIFLVSRGADVSVRDQSGRTPLDRMRKSYELVLLGAEGRELLEQVLGGFMTARVIEARPEYLVVRVERLHSRFTDAERQARERGMLTVPCSLFYKELEPGETLHCRKGLSPALDDAWGNARMRDLGIERER